VANREGMVPVDETLSPAFWGRCPARKTQSTRWSSSTNALRTGALL